MQFSADTTSGDIETSVTYPGSGYAVLISAVVHLIVLLILSLIVLSGITDTKPVLTVVIDEELGDSPEFQDIPEVKLEVASDTSLPEVTKRAKVDLPESALEIASSFLPSNTSQASADSEGTDADPEEVSAIQGRVDSAGGKRGEVQFALAWKNINDVDLHVIAPSGERISYNHKRSQCQGLLDVDMNVKGESNEPVENIRWLRRKTPAGRYTILVNLYRVHFGRGATDYQLLAKLGTKSEIVEDTVAGGRSIVVHRFKYVPTTYGVRRRKQMLDQLDRLQKIEEKKATSLLDRAMQVDVVTEKDRKLREIIQRYPHTDSAIEALKRLSGTTVKS